MHPITFDDNFNYVTALLSDRDEFNDLDVKTIKQKDLYGTPISYGDPFMFVHIMPATDFLKVMAVEAVHGVLNFRNKGRYTERILDIFSSANMISHGNVQQLCREYILFYNFAMHLFMTPRT